MLSHQNQCHLDVCSPYWVDALLRDANFVIPALNLSALPAWGEPIDMGLALLRQGKAEGALLQFQRALERAKGELQRIGLSHFCIALAAQNLGQMDLAFCSAKTAAELLCQCPGCHYLLGFVALKQRNWAQAFSSWEEAVRLDTSLAKVHAGLALLYAIERRNEEAEMSAVSALSSGAEVDSGFVGLALWQAKAEQGKPWDGTRFHDPGDVGELDAVVSQFATMTISYVSPSFDRDSPVVFISSDVKYFYKFTLAQILSLLCLGGDFVLHVHVVNPDPQVLPTLQRISTNFPDFCFKLTAEVVDVKTLLLPRTYYSSVRFIRLWQAMQGQARRYVLTDADVLFNRPVIELLNAVTDVDAGLSTFPDDPAWQRYCAACGVYSPKGGASVLARTAWLIAQNLLNGHGHWFLDQVSLFVAERRRKNDEKIVELPANMFCDIDCKDNSVVWCVSNNKSNAANRFNLRREALLDEYGLGDPKGFNVWTHTKYGLMVVNRHDVYIGRSLTEIGVWCEHELLLFAELVEEGDTVIEAGANYGSHTLALAALVGSRGQVFAFEPQRLVFQALCGSLALNSVTNVYAHLAAVGERSGEVNVPLLNFSKDDNFGAMRLVSTNKSNKTQSVCYERVPLVSIDSLELRACRLIKADVEGMELSVIRGARQTIAQFRPFLYLENHNDDQRIPLIDYCRSLGYRLYWHGTESDPNMFCVPNESPLVLPESSLVA